MRTFFLSIILMFCILPIHSQVQRHFYHLDNTNGLINNEVNCVYRDKIGYAWIATSNGVDRYDGSRFKHYFSNYSDSVWLSNISEIKEDALGNLWLKRNYINYYVVYNRKKDNFYKHFMLYLKDNDISMPANPLKMEVDLSGNLWFLYDKAVKYYNFRNKQTKSFAIAGTNDIKFSRDMAYCLLGNGMICKISLHNNSMEFDASFAAICKRHSYRDFYLYVDRQNEMWIYSKWEIGVYYYENNKRWLYFSHSSEGDFNIKNNLIRAISDDGNGNIWIALEHAGLNIFSKKDRRVYSLEKGQNGIVSNRIISLYLDVDRTLWMGYWKNGLSFSSNRPISFESYEVPVMSRSEYKDDVSTLLVDRNKNLWVGTDGNGLAILNKDMTLKKHYDFSKLSDAVVCLFEDRMGRVWAGVYRDGLYCFDHGKMTHIKKGEKGLEDENVWYMIEDSDGYFWIAGLNSGPQRWNDSKQCFEKSLQSMWLSKMCNARKGYIYAGGFGYSPINTRLLKCGKMVLGNRKGTQAFSDKELRELFYDSRGLVWVGGTRGVSVFDESADHIYYVDQDNGLCNNIVQGIIEDKNHDIWITTDKGLSKITVRRVANHYDFLIKNFSEKDGLLNLGFNQKAIFVDKEGYVYVGGNKGFSIFKPNKNTFKFRKPKVLFTDIQVGNDIIQVDSIYHGHKILDTNLNDCREVHLDYSDRMITIYFSAPDCIAFGSFRYAYKMESTLGSDWVYTSNDRVSFDHLAPGKYILKVKAYNGNGLWGEESTLVIKVSPPFYLSWWAYLIYIIVIGGAAYYTYYIIRRRQNEKMHIQQIKMELEKQEHINNMKMEFFTNVSHDFRTPLSLIITPIEKLLEENKSKPIAKTLGIIHHNAQLLTNLVNQLLNFRRLDEVGERIYLSKSDYVAFIKGLCSEFELYKKEKSIKLSFDSNVETFETLYDKEKVRKIMMNLLSNALKFSPSNSEVRVQLELKDDQLYTSVKDNGIGISDVDKNMVFERFYQVDKSHQSFGSGIGLHIVKEYVTLLGGEIRVTDNNPCGTVFTFNLPIAKEEEIVEQPIEEPAPVVAESKEQTNIRTTILIVEDNDDFRNFLDECLNEDYRILKAINGKEGLDLLHQEEVNLIISDVMMPVMDGLELCRRVKTDIALSHIPIILLTARTTEEHKIEGLKDGADDYLTKPFNLNILKLRIEKLLRWSSERHEAFTNKRDIKPSEITISSLDEQLIEKAIKAVEDNMGNSEFSVEDLGQAIGLSRGHLYRKLMSITGKGPLEFIRVLRLKRSQQYLEKSKMSVSEIAYIVGFNSPKIFSKYFKETFGISPSDYKEQHSDK